MKIRKIKLVAFGFKKYSDYNVNGPVDETAEIDATVGAYMLVPKAVIEKVGLLDEDYFMYGEDLDWCWEAKAAGYKVIYYPKAEITHFKYGSAQCVLAWVDLPVIARYQMEFAFYSPERRVTLSFPSPFLRSMPTMLTLEEGEPDSPRASRVEEVTSYRESFKEELVHFHDCVTTGRTPFTSGKDSLHDIALCESVVAVHRSRTSRDHPSEAEMVAAPTRHS